MRTIIEHLGSAHDPAGVAALITVGQQKILGGQQAFDLDGLAPGVSRPTMPTVVGSTSRVLWDVLEHAYTVIGFDTVGDDAFKKLVLARIIEPVSKADTIRVLGELGIPSPSLRTIWRTLVRCIDGDWREAAFQVAYAHAAKATSLSLVLYDVTTLYFEAAEEDELRKVGMSKERRVDPQVVVGLLVTPGGFPLEIHLFEGNKAETLTLIPVLASFQQRHEVTDLVVVADAGMLSAANLSAMEDAGFKFIVGSRISKAPYDLAAHFQAHGATFTNGQTLETTRRMGTGVAARARRIVYHYSWQRHKRDNYTLNKQIERAEKILDGRKPLKKDRFVKMTGARRELDQGLIDRAQQLFGLKGYVTNIPQATMDSDQVVSAYHELFQVERSFRMAKTDLRARPMFHHQEDSIQAHLTVVFMALAVSRHLQDVTGVSIRKLVQQLRPLRDVRIRLPGGQEIIAATPPAGEAHQILDTLGLRI